MGLVKTFLLGFLLLLVSSSSALGQAEGHTGIEGYVFSQATGKPLYNAKVSFVTCVPGGGLLTYQTTTDFNGFYQLDIQGTEPVMNKHVVAECISEKANVNSFSVLYPEVRPIVYRRDFYLNVQKSRNFCHSVGEPRSDFPDHCADR